MCDICTLNCVGCKRTIEIHIGDFCVTRESVVVFCHECQQTALKYLLAFDKEMIVFADDGCLFMVQLPRSIALNGSRDECVGIKE